MVDKGALEKVFARALVERLLKETEIVGLDPLRVILQAKRLLRAPTSDKDDPNQLDLWYDNENLFV